MSNDELVQKAKKLINNAEIRYYNNQSKARHGLVAAERLLDGVILKKGMTRFNPANPYLEFYNKIYRGWEYLNRKRDLGQTR